MIFLLFLLLEILGKEGEILVLGLFLRWKGFLLFEFDGTGGDLEYLSWVFVFCFSFFLGGHLPGLLLTLILDYCLKCKVK